MRAVQVLDGVAPEGKRDVSGRTQRSESRVGRLVQQLCKYMVREVANLWFESIVVSEAVTPMNDL